MSTKKTDLMVLADQMQENRLPPAERWNPPLSGEMDLRIARDGTWIHEGSPIWRESLVRLFSTILRWDEDGHHYLVTPVEKWRIQVDDAPFVAVWMTVAGAGEDQELAFRTNLDDEVTAGPQHPIRVAYSRTGEPSPYIHIRARLWALMSRNVFMEVAESAIQREVDGERLYGVWSQKMFFPLGRLEE